MKKGYTRKIDGKIYIEQGRHTTKSSAKKQANYLREPNSSVRIISAPKYATTGNKKINFLVYGRLRD